MGAVLREDHAVRVERHHIAQSGGVGISSLQVVPERVARLKDASPVLAQLGKQLKLDPDYPGDYRTRADLDANP